MISEIDQARIADNAGDAINALRRIKVIAEYRELTPSFLREMVTTAQNHIGIIKLFCEEEKTIERCLTPPITNRKQLIAALLDKDGEQEGTFGMILDHVDCPYTSRERRGHCDKANYHNVTDEMCFECREAWLDKEVNE